MQTAKTLSQKIDKIQIGIKAAMVVTIAIMLMTVLLPKAFADSTMGGASGGDNFILRKGSMKEPIEAPIIDPSEDVDMFNELMRGYGQKKESGTWNRDGRPIQATPVVSGKVMLPVSKGRVSSQFGVRSMGGTDYHKGIDISRNGGEDIVLPMDCKIIDAKVGYNLGAGNYVKASSVENPNMVFTFMHMKGTPKIAGTPVNQLKGKTYPAGTVIGQVGNTGASTGPHLHFQVVQTKAAMTGGVASKFKGAVPPIHALFGEDALTNFKAKLTLGTSNNRKENKLMTWKGKTVEQREMK